MDVPLRAYSRAVVLAYVGRRLQLRVFVFALEKDGVVRLASDVSGGFTTKKYRGARGPRGARHPCDA